MNKILNQAELIVQKFVKFVIFFRENMWWTAYATGSTTNCGIFEKDSESQLTSHNLLLCFLNETPSDLEEDATEDIIDDTKVRIL